MTTDNIDDVMRRVRKLLAIAEDNRANAAEASAAAGMAERIMRKFQIEHADVIEAELKRGGAESFASSDCGSSLNPETGSVHACGWAGVLAVHVAELHDCIARFVRTPQYGMTLRFQGYKSDAEMARFTYVYLVQTMAAAGRQYLRENPYAGRRGAEQFRRGFSSALGRSLAQALKDKRQAMQSESASRSLVIVKDRAVTAHFGAAQYKTSRRTERRGESFAEGFARGSSVDVNRRGLGGTTGGEALIGG